MIGVREVEMKKLPLMISLSVLLMLSFFTANNASAAKAKITVTRKVATSPVRAGTPFQLHATKPDNAKKEKLIWKSSQPKYAKVSKKGVVTAKKAGVGKQVKIVCYLKDTPKVRGRIWLNILPKINPHKKMIAITYDDGPNAKTTPTVLSALKKNHAVATFFTIGANLASPENRKVLKQSFDYGNEIGNHTLNHYNIASLSSESLHHQIAKTDSLIYSVTGKKPVLFRPPYGSISTRSLALLNKPAICWSVDTLDWKTLSTQSTYNAVISKAGNGSIVLMHDIHQSTAAAADSILRSLKERGYQFVTVSELFSYKNKSLKQNHVYHNN